MTSLDPAYCADGCGRLAETERPATGELVCLHCRLFDFWTSGLKMTQSPPDTHQDHAKLGEHSSNPREDG